MTSVGGAVRWWQGLRGSSAFHNQRLARKVSREASVTFPPLSCRYGARAVAKITSGGLVGGRERNAATKATRVPQRRESAAGIAEAGVAEEVEQSAVDRLVRHVVRGESPRCQATWKTAPPVTVKTDPPEEEESADEEMRRCRPVGGEATGTDDEVRRGGGDSAPAGARLGAEAHRQGVRVQQEHGETLRRGRRLDGVQPTNGWRQARGSGGVVEGALLPAPRQCRGGAAGPAAGAVDRREPADGRAGGRAVAAAAGGRGEGDGAVRDAPGTSTADRFRPVAGAGRGRAGARLPVRGDAGLLAALPCGGVPARAAVVLVSRPGGRVRSLRRRDEGGADRQPAAAGGRSRRVDARGRVQRAVPGVRGLLGVPPSGVCAVSSPDEGEGRARSRLRQAKRHRWPSFRELGGDGGASGLVAAGGCRPAAPRHHR